MPGTRKLNRPTDQRKAMLRNLVTSFLENGRIETTLTRAKETQSMAEKMITLVRQIHYILVVRHWSLSQKKTL